MTRTLILIPTLGEFQILQPRLKPLLSDQTHIEICGFGPVAAAARTAQLIAAIQPELIWLTGIAGSFSPDFAPGYALEFTRVGMYGIGAGSGDTYLNAGELGWLHWNDVSEVPGTNRDGMNRDGDSPAAGSVLRPAQKIGDQMVLAPDTSPATNGPLLLTVCSAASTQKEVRERLGRFPDAIAEDMEGFAVATAAALAGVPVRIIRGISNFAGDRHKARWRITDALQAAAEQLVDACRDGN